MKEILLKKVHAENFVFSDKEVHWLMENIGNTDAVIRDEIVFSSLASGLVEGTFTFEQFAYIKDKTINENLIFYHIEEGLPTTLTRSFSALLNGFIVQVDGDHTSLFYHSLTEEERQYFFNSSVSYLQKEFDRTGYSEKYGWVHAFAHGGDYLSKVVSHDLFQASQVAHVLEAIRRIIYRTEVPFLDEEEKRIAHVLFMGVKHKKMSNKLLINWIQSVSFPLDNNLDFYRLAMFKNMLAYIYFHCLSSNCLDVEIEKALLDCLAHY